MPKKEYVCPICGKETTKEKYEEINDEYSELIEYLEKNNAESLVEIWG